MDEHGQSSPDAVRTATQPIEGWHCSHFFYRFRRDALQALDATAIERGSHEFAEQLDPERPSAPSRLQTSIVSGHRADFALLLTVLGAQLLIEGFVRIADEAGLGTGFVGLSMVAMGTSAPELVTAVVAVRGGHSELVLGNVLGSNLLNSLAGGSVMALIGPGSLTDENLEGLATYTMLAVTGLALLFMITSRVIQRWEAAILVAIYLAAIPFLISEEEEAVDEALGLLEGLHVAIAGFV